MGDILRAGLVGCGSVSQRGILPHMCLADTQERVKLVAVVDAVEERARQTAERFGVEAYFTQVDDMLVQADVDLVLIATPIPYHFPVAMKAIAAGKHVYVQKTMTTTVAEANELLAARDKAGVKLAAAPGYELCSTTREMREVVTSGTLGPVYVAYTYTLGFGHEQESIRGGEGTLAAIDPSWYYRPGAGPLPDVTVYALQLITSVLGPVRRVTALGNRILKEIQWKEKQIPIETDDNTVILMEFVSGTIGVAVGSNCRGSQRVPWGSIGLYGLKGAMEVTEVEMNSGYPVAFNVQAPGAARSWTTTLAEQPYLKGEHLNIEEPHIHVDIMDLVDAIYEDRKPRASGEQARHVVEIVEAARKAVSSREAQELTSTFEV